MKKTIVAMATVLAAISCACAEDLVITADTTLEENKNIGLLSMTSQGTTLELAGFDLTCTSFQFAEGSVIQNSDNTKLATITFKQGRFGENALANVTFNGNLKLVLDGQSTKARTLIGHANYHTGGTTLNGFYDAANNDPLNNSQMMRMVNPEEYGTGTLTLKNGSRVNCNSGAAALTFNGIVAVNDEGNTMPNVFYMENNMTLQGDVYIEGETTLAIVRKGRNVWTLPGSLKGMGELYIAADNTVNIASKEQLAEFLGTVSANGDAGRNAVIVAQNNANGDTYFGQSTSFKLAFGRIEVAKNAANIEIPNCIDVAEGTENSIYCNEANFNFTGELSGGGTLNFTQKNRGARLSGDNSKFSGTVTFSPAGNNNSAGFYAPDSGSAGATWTVLGHHAPGNSDYQKTLMITGCGNASLHLGAFNVVDPAAIIQAAAQNTMIVIGEKNEDCVVNGTFAPPEGNTKPQAWKNVKLTKKGTANLTLGENCAFVDGSTIKVEEGTLVNNANLSNVDAEIWEGARVSGTGSFKSVTCKGADVTATIGTAAKSGDDWTITADSAADAARVAGMIPAKITLTQTQIDSGIELSYYKNGTVTDNGDGTYSLGDVKFSDDVLVNIGEDTTVTVGDVDGKITFATPTNLKKGLYYALGEKTVAEGDASAIGGFTQYTGDNAGEMVFTADLPENGVKYYTIMVSDDDASL